MDAYIELQRVHLDPTNARAFEADNQRLSATQPAMKRVVMFGDSRIAMWRATPNISDCQWINRGVGGQTTAELLQRLDRDVIELHPDLVLIEMGVNNLKTIGVFPDQEGKIVKSCNQDTDLILRRLSDHNVPVAMLTIFPAGPVAWSRRPVWSDRIRSAIVAYNQRLATLKTPGLTVIDCDPALSVKGRMNSR
jgi:lysophospholipase L1-like esterase